jgi:hypothetical protein
MFSSKSRLTLWFVTLLIIATLSACTPSPDASRNGIYPVDPTFADFYRQFGGDSTLGPAISPSFIKVGLTYQYVVSGLMTYNPNEVPLKRFHFSPVAASVWQIHGLVEPAPQDSTNRYENGHKIWEEVWVFYDQYGSDIIGLPLTGVTANDAKQRYEQYFDGLGFYRKYTDPPGQIHLMPYGIWMCGNACQYPVTDSTPPTASYAREYSATEQLFLQASERLGYGFTGAPLKSPQLGSDGYYEMTFENVVLYVDPIDRNQIRLRPLPGWLGIPAEPPEAQQKTAWLTFFQTEAGLGYNLPNTFTEYIDQHGSIAVSGDPLTEYHGQSDGGYSQCFTNLCLEYHPTAPLGLQVRPKPLGLEYLTSGAKSSTPVSTFTEALKINAWEDYPLIPSGTIQVIHIEATQNKVPLAGIEFSLVVKQPDGITKTYPSEPTGEDGSTRISLDPINGPNGAMVQYEVCVIGAVAPQVCFAESYTIWDQ